MKKIFYGMMTILLVLSLAACNQSKTNTNTTSNESQKTESLAEEIYNKAIEASKNVDSFYTELTSFQTVSLGGRDKYFLMNTEAQVINKPFSIYQTIYTSGNGEIGNLEIYYTPEQAYAYEKTEDVWLKLSDEDIQEIFGEFIGIKNWLTEDLSEQKVIAKELTVRDDGNVYTLIISDKSKNEVKAFFKDFIDGEIPEDSIPKNLNEIDIEDINFMEINYELVIDKETYYPLKISSNIELEITFGADTLVITNESASLYDNYNEIEEITIPQEAIDHAYEL